MQNDTNYPEIPLGLGIALSKNINGMNYFSSLSKDNQKQIIDQTHQVQSESEMQAFVQSLIG